MEDVNSKHLVCIRHIVHVCYRHTHKHIHTKTPISRCDARSPNPKEKTNSKRNHNHRLVDAQCCDCCSLLDHKEQGVVSCVATSVELSSNTHTHTHLVIRVQLVFARTIKTAHEKFKWPASPPPHYNSKTKQQKISLLPHQTINWMQCGRSVWWSHFHISRDSFLNPFVVVVIFASSSGLFFLMYNICFLAIRCVNVYTCGQRNRNSEGAFMMNDFYNNNNKTVTGNLSSDPQKHTS